MNLSKLAMLGLIPLLAACSSQDIPQAHKGRLFDKTGPLALYSGGKGFEGPILGPGTQYTGIYPEVRMVDCSQQTHKETMQALTKDGVQFTLDLFITYSANCADDKSVETLLNTLAPAGHAAPAIPGTEPAKSTGADPSLTITSDQVYMMYIRPAISESVRENISPYIANEVNAKREEIFAKIRDKFSATLKEQKPQLVLFYEVNLSNLDFPEEMDKANTDRATQSILKDKAIAEREKVTAEIETAKMRKELVGTEAGNEAAKIDEIGAALKRNPEYATLKMYEAAGEKGNLVIVPSGNGTVLQLPAKK